MRSLVFAHRHFRSLVQEYVGSHERRVCQQSGVDVLRVLAHFFLECRAALQLADVGVHVEEEVELADFRHVALHVECALLRVESCGEVIDEYALYVAVQVVGVRMCSK